MNMETGLPGEWQEQANWLRIRETAWVTTSWGWGTDPRTSQPVKSNPLPSRFQTSEEDGGGEKLGSKARKGKGGQ